MSEEQNNNRERREFERGKNFDIFISYRRSDGDKVARILDLAFKNAGCRCFLDYNSIEGGLFEQKIKVAIEDAPVFVMVMTPEYFLRCNQKGDWVRKEIELALANEKIIVPISIDNILTCVPDIGDEDFQTRVGAHNFAIVYTNSTFDVTFEKMLNQRIRRVINIVDNVRNKAKVRAIADVDCDLMRAGELIATLQAGKENLIYISGGKYEVKAESCDYRDIVQDIHIDISDVFHESDIKVKLAKRVKRREFKRWLKGIGKYWISLLAIIILLIVNICFYYLDGKPETTNDCFKTLKRHSSSVKSVNWSPDGKYLASGSLDETVKIWDAKNGRIIKTLRKHSDGVEYVIWSPDGKYLASGSLDNTVIIWDAKSGKELQTLEGHSDDVNSVSWSPDGRYLASASKDKTIVIWNANSGEEIHTLYGHSDDVNSVSWSPDGKYLASGSWDKTVIIWDVELKKEIQTLRAHLAGVESVSWSYDGKYLASGSNDNNIIIWDANSREEIQTLEEHYNYVEFVSWSPDGKYLASSGADNIVIIWDAESGECIRTFEGHTGNVSSVNWSPDGKYLVSGSNDNTVKIWGVE